MNTQKQSKTQETENTGMIWMLTLPEGRYVGAHANPDMEYIKAGNLPTTKHQYDALLFDAVVLNNNESRARLFALKEHEVPEECVLIHAAIMKTPGKPTITYH